MQIRPFALAGLGLILPAAVAGLLGLGLLTLFGKAACEL